MGTFLGSDPGDAFGEQRNGPVKPSAENLGSAEPQDLLFFLHGILSSAVAARGRPAAWEACSVF